MMCSSAFVSSGKCWFVILFPQSSADSRQDVVDADDAVGSGRAAVVHDGGVALHPHPAAVLGQEAVILGGDLSFHQHCAQ